MSLRANPETFQTQYNTDGSLNERYVDLLERDAPLNGQKYVCVSFVSPEKEIKQREIFFFEQFLKNWDFSTSLERFHEFLNFISVKYGPKIDDLMKDFEEFVVEENHNLKSRNVKEDYTRFLDSKEDELQKKYDIETEFRTNVRGLKIRGSFETESEARTRAKILQNIDSNFDTYVGEVGAWMPFHPDAYKTGDVQFLNDELNQLFHEKRDNEEKARMEFENRVRDAKRRAIEENIKKAKETGNKLTQNIDEKGQLYDVNNRGEKDEISVADIKNELFENREAVTKDMKKND